MIDKYFEKYNEICDDIRSMLAELRVKKEELYSISGVSYDSNIKSTKLTGLEFYIDKIINIENNLKAKEKERIEKYEQHLSLINKLEDKRERFIIKQFYLERLSINQIASILYVSEGHLKRIKSSAVKHFEKMLPDVT